MIIIIIMSVLYYLAVILLAIGLPVLAIYLIFVVVRPHKLQKFTDKQFSRKRIAATGSGGLLAAAVILGATISGTMPESVKADIAAQKTARIEAEAKDAAKHKPVVKTETTKVVVKYTSSEKQDAVLAKGTRKTTTMGVNGEKKDYYEVTYVDGKQTAKKFIKSEVAKQPINEVVTVGTYVAAKPKANPAPALSPQPVYAPAPSPTPASTYYANCTEARAAGVAPIYVGEPGYRSALDRDSDGIACE